MPRGSNSQDEGKETSREASRALLLRQAKASEKATLMLQVRGDGTWTRAVMLQVERSGDRQEADGLQGRHLQLIFHLHFLRQESGTTNLLFILPEAGDRWTLGDTFTTSHLSTLQDRNNNRHKANNWRLSPVNLLNNGDDRIRGGAAPCWGRTKRSRPPHPRGQGDPNYTCAERPLWVRKGGGARP